MSAEYSAVPRKAGKRITAKERGINKYMYETAEYSALLFWDSFPLYHALIFFLFYISPVCSFPVFPAVFSVPPSTFYFAQKKNSFSRKQKSPRSIPLRSPPPPHLFIHWIYRYSLSLPWFGIWCQSSFLSSFLFSLYPSVSFRLRLPPFYSSTVLFHIFD